MGQWKIMVCPSNPACARPGWPGLTHYVGIAGLGSDAAERPAGYPGNGIFGYDRHIGLHEIPHGTSQTLMLIETTRENGPWTAGGFPTVRGLDSTGGLYLGQGGQFGSVLAGEALDGLEPDTRRAVHEALQARLHAPAA